MNPQDIATHASELAAMVADYLDNLPLDASARKELLRQMIAPEQVWGALPPWSTLEAPAIREVETATLGAGAALTFREHGIVKAVVLKAGSHYTGMADAGAAPFEAVTEVPTYMIPGGFVDLAHDATIEDAVIREINEELVSASGAPLLTGDLAIEPSQLVLTDAKLLFLPHEKRVVHGYAVTLTPAQAKHVQAHAARMEEEPAYRHAVRAGTVNPASGKPEVCSVAILPLKDLVEGVEVTHRLLHSDQLSLFEKLRDTLNTLRKPER